MAEAAAFFAGLQEQLEPAAGIGACAEHHPERLRDCGPTAPEPDCRSAVGCLFCKHHRDIRSFDHVWQLVSYRDLALRELRQTVPEDLELSPRTAVVERIAAKLRHFRTLGAEWEEWIVEAERRASIDHYHDLFVEQWLIVSGKDGL